MTPLPSDIQQVESKVPVQGLRELCDLELALIGGGIGEVVVG